MALYKELISQQEVTTTGVTGISFGSLPSNYTSLEVHIHSRSADNSVIVADVFMSLNSSNNRQAQRAFGRGGTFAAGFGDGSSISQTNGGNSTANTFGSCVALIHNYSDTSKYTNVLSYGGSENTLGTSYQKFTGSVWQFTTVVDTLEVTLSGLQQFEVGSKVTVFGIVS